MHKLYMKRTVESPILPNTLGFDWILETSKEFVFIDGYRYISYMQQDSKLNLDHEVLDYQKIIGENYDLWCVSDKITLHVNYKMSDLLGKLPKDYQ